MDINQGLRNIKVRCINLVSRKDKRKVVKKHLRKKKIKYEFYRTKKHNNPKRGCLESHLNLINESVKNKDDNLLILEDDVYFTRPFKNIPEPPKNWDMLYFGGTVNRLIDKVENGWTKMCCYTTHAYMVNLNNKELIEEINKADEYDGEIDKYYLDKIHKKFNCYMMTPMIAIQRSGYSDIEKRMVNYDFMEKTLNGLMIPEHEIIDGEYILKLPDYEEKDLPNVSIITPTYNRRHLFSLPLHNFDNFIYPKEKMEWIIIDDTPEDKDQLDDIIPTDDNRIRFLKIGDVNTKLTISHKRNIGAQKAKYDIIIHMDDDDYYPPHSILSRVKCLMKYKNKGIECIGCSKIGNYNLITGTSSISTDGPISLSEASMAYTKNFWKQRRFDSECERGEHKFFTEGRLDKILDIPYSFVITAFDHKDNFTEDLRKRNKDNKKLDFYIHWDDEFQLFVDMLKKKLNSL